MTQESELVSKRLGLPRQSVEATILLLEDGATVPFISRYRKELTGSLDEVAVRAIESNLAQVRQLMARKDFIREAIEAVGAMTSDIAAQIERAETTTELEDIYAPYKPKRRTRATVAKEKGLEPLARIIMAGNTSDCISSARRFVGKNDVKDEKDALAGASDIIAEWASESIRMRNITRNSYRRNAVLVSKVVKTKEAELMSTPFAQYGDFRQTVRRMPSHQYLAMRRAEREGLVKVKYDLGNSSEELDQALCNAFIPRHATDQCADVIEKAVLDASARLLRPSVENEISAELKDEADRVAIDLFAQNLRQLLLAAPLKGFRVLAIDPGYRTGCKIVALDKQGNLLDDAVIYPVPPRLDIAGSQRIVESFVEKYNLDVVAIGNGTASRETERFIKDSHIVEPSKVFVVSEDGASVYSASDIARQEFPDKDVTVRGAVSIGRRLIDPLAELVKIDAKSIGVGQYQHDVDQNRLKDSLDYTVMSCVNTVGVDVNTASEKLLSYISGIGPALASNIVDYRYENGDFTSRASLKKVPRLGDKAYELAAGFLRVPGGREPLDNTAIHPESYSIVSAIAKRLNVRPGDLHANGPLLDSIDVESLVAAGIGGKQTIDDIIAELRKPGRDPRTDDNSNAFVPAVDSFEELRVGQTLPGLVNNITAFGAFVDLGIKENGLLHISQLSHKRVAAVSDVLHIGQQIMVKVIDIDTPRRRISLSMKDV
ncbi:MAG: RNA-binding transcriptional accessory protein [Muribaculaceae bacterium]|nr:RNA-binding transcriptional accessory protein [Muribaculaceae bacterium]